MSKLLLTSAGFENPKIGEVFLQLINKPVTDISVLFIPTAAISEEAMYYVEKSKIELLRLGIKENNICIFNMEYRVTYDEIKSFDAIYICGGNTLHLLNKVKEKAFDCLIREFINANKLYLGVSAGSTIVGPMVQGVSGLGIVDIIISPHYCNENKEKVKNLEAASNYKVIPLTDKQAVLVENEDFIIVE